MEARRPDTLDKTVQFLAKRDGIDKVLKIIRYTSKLALVTTYADSKSEFALRLREFESSIGTSRKAYRLGKFLADVNKLRKTPLTTRLGLLEAVANSGEGIYYFVEQLTWLVKAGMLDKRHAAQFSLLSAYAEMAGYAANITINLWRIYLLLERDHLLSTELRRVERGRHIDKAESVKELRREITMLRAERLVRSLAVLQDLADSMLALNDIRGGSGRPSNPALLCVAGLISAAISVQKNWP